MSGASPAAGTQVWTKPVREFPGLVHLAPPACHPEDSLHDVVVALSQDPGARCVYVIDTEDKVLGGVPEHVLDRDLITQALPQALWSTVHEMDTRELLRAARGEARTARQLMTKTRTVKEDAPLSEAITAMARSGENVVALVDGHDRLLGYLALFEVLAELAKHHN